MRNVVILTVAFAMMLGLCTGGAGWSQSVRCIDPVRKRSVGDQTGYPTLGIEYSRVGRVKLSSRKSTYRLSEMISVDIAVLNTSKEKVFFHNLNEHVVTLTAKDDKGSKVDIFPMVVSMEGVIPESYYLVLPNEITSGSLELFVGCDTPEYMSYRNAYTGLTDEISKGRISYGRGFFDRDLFVNWGYACLRASRPGVYTITAEIENHHIVVSPCEGNPKSAIGKITSPPFTITITE